MHARNGIILLAVFMGCISCYSPGDLAPRPIPTDTTSPDTEDSDSDTVIPSPPIEGCVLFVKHDAAGSETGQSWADACTDIQPCVNLAAQTINSDDSVSECEVWVAAGTYTPTQGKEQQATLTLKEHVALYAGFTGTETSLEQRNWSENKTVLSGKLADGASSYHVVTGADFALIDGFVITEGNANGSGDHENGGGMFNDGVSPSIVNCSFEMNTAASGGGAMHNQNGASPTIHNCTFSNNEAMFGGAMLNTSQSSPDLTNCTISANKSNSPSDGGSGIYNMNSVITITNTILWGNVGQGDQFYIDASSASTIEYSNIHGLANPEYNHNIVVDPLFTDTDTTNLDLRLSCQDYFDTDNCSPCIDAGTYVPYATISADPTPGRTTQLHSFTDIDGKRRIYGGGVDMGAYEYDSCSIVRVDENASGAKTGTSWPHALEKLEDAWDKVTTPGSAICEIWIAEGTYSADYWTSSEGYFIMMPFVGTYGGFDPATDPQSPKERDFIDNETILDGDSTVYHVVRGADHALLDGFTITGGMADGSEDTDGTIGAGMLNIDASPTVLNCKFVSNNADSDGAGMYNRNSNPTLFNCQFDNNTGGGLYNYESSPFISNCEFTGNTYGMTSEYVSRPDIQNSIVSANSGAGLIQLPPATYVTLTNCLVENNTGSGLSADMNSYIQASKCLIAGNNIGITLTGDKYMSFSNASLSDCEILNSSSRGVSIQAGELTARRTVIAGNREGGIIIGDGAARLTNSAVAYNVNGPGISISNEGTISATNCSIVGNSNSGIYATTPHSSQYASITVKNTILWDNANGDADKQVVLAPPPLGVINFSIEHSNIQGGCFDTDCDSWPASNIDADPMFVSTDTDSWDLHLSCDDPSDTDNCSPCVDAGDTDIAPETMDLDGMPRIQGATVDMGAYEFPQ